MSAKSSQTRSLQCWMQQAMRCVSTGSGYTSNLQCIAMHAFQYQMQQALVDRTGHTVGLRSLGPHCLQGLGSVYHTFPSCTLEAGGAIVPEPSGFSPSSSSAWSATWPAPPASLACTIFLFFCLRCHLACPFFFSLCAQMHNCVSPQAAIAAYSL